MKQALCPSLFRGAAILCLGVVFGATAGRPAFAQASRPVDVAAMSLEELLNLEITSAAKKGQRITETAAAVYVITSDDIRKSQATTIMELLRQVPGALVAREATGEWSISIRGFNDKHANKLLVLMDGRTLYSPLYSGVEWDIQDTLLEDIDRIEVVRGPGATLWGANAVNGVINIITKHSSDTQGAAASYQVDGFDSGTVAGRYGGSIGDTAQFRVFSKYFSRPSLPAQNDGPTPSKGWNGFRQGGRLDWSPTKRDEITVSGEWFENGLHEIDDELTSLEPPFSATVEEHDKTSAGFVVGRWTRKRDDSELTVQLFHDHVRQYDGRGNDKDESIDTTDLDVQHGFRAGRRHDLVVGGGVRQVRDRVMAAFDSWFTPTSHSARTYNLFLQDEISLFGDAVTVTAGSKIEWNEFTKGEVQPTARALWNVSREHGVWGAASRAVRVPSRTELHQQSVEEIDVDEDDQIVYEFLTGTSTLVPEKLTAYEAGYRFIPNKTFSADLAAFYNVYDDLFTIETGEEFETTTPVAGLRTPLFRANHGFGTVYGFEAVGYWTVHRNLQLTGSYTRLQMRTHVHPDSTDEDVEAYGEQNAHNLFHVRAYATLPYKLTVNTDVRFVGAIPGQEVSRYVDGNVHVSRSVGRGMRLGITLENLFRGDRVEWDGEDGLVQTRNVRVGVGWRF